MPFSKAGSHMSANLIHSLDAHMHNTIHAAYKARKPGLLAQRIEAEKHARLEATYKARPEVKRDIMVALYGGEPMTSTGALLVKQGIQMWAAVVASWSLKHTEHGDFTHLTGRGI